MSAEPGHQQVVYSQSETIGLPNWSFFTITASIKTVVPIAQADATWDYCSSVTDAYILERAEQAAREVGTFYGNEGALQRLTEEEKMALTPAGLTVVLFELTYTQKEVIGLPNKAKIELFGSSGISTAPGQEFQGFRYLGGNVARKMFEKREVVKTNPRPWTTEV